MTILRAGLGNSLPGHRYLEEEEEEEEKPSLYDVTPLVSEHYWTLSLKLLGPQISLFLHQYPSKFTNDLNGQTWN